MARPRKNRQARTADSFDPDAVVALLLADDPTCDDNAELRRLLRANAKITKPVAEVGGYCRISEYRPERNADGSIGVLRQAKRILRHATDHQVRVVRWYMDNDFSAANPSVKRPSYLALLDDIRARRVGGLLVWDIPRLYRQSKEFQELVEVYDSFPKGQQPFVSTTDGKLDLTDQMGRFVAELLVLIGKLESANISKRIRDKINARFEEGAWQGGTVPYGYRLPAKTIGADGAVVNGARGRLEVEPTEAAVAKEMARLILEGWNLTKVCRHLNASGYKPRRGDYWRTQTIRDMMLNPLYAGVRRHQARKPLSFDPDGEERRTRGSWPGILTEAEMAELAAILTAEGRRTTPERGGAVRRYLGSGVIVCGVCGAKQVRGRPDTSGPRYQCLNGLCMSRDVKMVDEWLRNFIVEAASSEGDLLAEALAEPNSADDPGRAGLLARLAVIQAELGKDPATVVKECGLTFATYAQVRAGLEAEEQELLAQLVPSTRRYAPVLPPTEELEAMLADPDQLAPVHDLLTTYLDAYNLEIVMHRVGRGAHNARNRKGITAAERRALVGLEVRERAAEAAA